MVGTMTKNIFKKTAKKRHVALAEDIFNAVLEDAPVGIFTLSLSYSKHPETDEWIEPEVFASTLLSKTDKDTVSVVLDPELNGPDHFITTLASFLAQKDTRSSAHFNLLAGYTAKEGKWSLDQELIDRHFSEPVDFAEAWVITHEWIEPSSHEGKLGEADVQPGHDLLEFEDDFMESVAPTKSEVTRYLLVEEHFRDSLTEVCGKAPSGEHFVTFHGAAPSYLSFTKSRTGVMEIPDQFLSEMVENAASTLYNEGDSAFLTVRTFLNSGASEMRGWEFSDGAVHPLTRQAIGEITKIDAETGAPLDNEARKITFCDAW